MVAFVEPNYEPDFAYMLTYGVLSRRVMAWLIDLFVLGLLLGGYTVFATGFTVMTFGLGYGAYALLTVIPLLYLWISVTSSMSATPGQAICGLRVVDNETLERPGAAQVLIWIIGYWLTVGVLFPLLFIAVFSVRHRALHDIVSGVVVVRRRVSLVEMRLGLRPMR